MLWFSRSMDHSDSEGQMYCVLRYIGLEQGNGWSKVGAWFGQWCRASVCSLCNRVHEHTRRFSQCQQFRHVRCLRWGTAASGSVIMCYNLVNVTSLRDHVHHVIRCCIRNEWPNSWSRGNDLDLYLGGAWFESQRGHQIFSVRFCSMVFLTPSRQVPI
jgi:hypothetical protein